MFDEISFVTNNNKLDTHTAEFIDMWSRLTVPEGKKAGYNDMIGEMNISTRFGLGDTIYTQQVDSRSPQYFASSKPQFKVILPLLFWWCLDWTQALPIGVLIFSELWVEVKFKAASDLYMISDNNAADWSGTTNRPTTNSVSPPTAPTIVDAKLFVDYVYLPNSARNRIADLNHFFVIRQTKHHGSQPITSSSLSYRLPFVLPTTLIMFGVRADAATTMHEYHFWDKYYGNDGSSTSIPYHLPDTQISTATIKILADDRQSSRDYLYYNRYVPFKHFSCIPESRGIWTYSFSLFPESSQVSGVINLSAAEQNYVNITMNVGLCADGSTTGGVGDGTRTG